MSDERQIPKSKEYIANPLYWDVVYGYIQANSEWDGIQGHPRIFSKKKANFSKMSQYLNLSRQTTSKHFKDLEGGLNLIKKLDNGDYEITILDATIATLINNDTLRALTSACNNHTISIYVYLYSRWKASKEKSFNFTYEQLKKVIGIGTNSTSNNYIIKDIINILCQMHLLEIETSIKISESGGYYTDIKVINMKDQIYDAIKENIERKKC